MCFVGFRWNQSQDSVVFPLSPVKDEIEGGIDVLDGWKRYERSAPKSFGPHRQEK